MTWDQALLVALAVVDLAALTVGLTILRRVTRIVVETGEAIHGAVASSIDEAKRDTVEAFIAALAPALAHLPNLLGGMKVSAEGRLSVDEEPKPDDSPILFDFIDRKVTPVHPLMGLKNGGRSG